MEFLDNVATCNTSLIDERIIFHRLKQAYATLYNTKFQKLLLSSYTTLHKHDISKFNIFLLFSYKSVVFETSYVYNVAYVF